MPYSASQQFLCRHANAPGGAAQRTAVEQATLALDEKLKEF